MRVFIENEAGSFVKNIHDEKILNLIATTTVSRSYPFPYGFVLNTRAEDGDNVDCFVLTKKMLRTGQIVECDAIALMDQIEDGEVDHKVLAVMDGDEAVFSEDIKAQLVEFAKHVFEHIPGKTMQVGGFRDQSAALAYVREHLDSAPAG